MRVALDATPLLGRPTGVGRYVAGLVEGLQARPDRPDLVLTGFSRSGGEPATAGARWSRRRVPARVLQQLWLRAPLPPVEWLSGPCDVFHATNFVLPPRRRAAGVVTVHDLTFEHSPDLVTPAVTRYRTLVPRAVAAAGAVCTPSEAVADEVRARYPAAHGKVHVTPLGVDPAWALARPADPDWLASRRLPTSYILAVGTLEPRKNLARLLAAHARLRAQGAPDLVVVGPAGWGPRIGAGPGVHLTGWLDDDDLRSLVAGAGCLVQPTLYEGFGLPPLEALAAGTPVACSDLPVLREVVEDLAHLADPLDPASIAAAVTAALADTDPAARAARRERATAFTWARCADRTLTAYAAAWQDA